MSEKNSYSPCLWHAVLDPRIIVLLGDGPGTAAELLTRYIRSKHFPLPFVGNLELSIEMALPRLVTSGEVTVRAKVYSLPADAAKPSPLLKEEDGPGIMTS